MWWLSVKHKNNYRNVDINFNFLYLNLQSGMDYFVQCAWDGIGGKKKIKKIFLFMFNQEIRFSVVRWRKIFSLGGFDFLNMGDPEILLTS